MKKILLFVFMGLSVASFGQKKEKIKGNKEVLIKKFFLPHFNSIKVGEKFEVQLKIAQDTTKLIIETDSNLFDVIHFKVEDNTLSFFTSMEIVNKKRLRITVFVPDELQSIEVYEKGKVFNDEILSLNTLEVIGFDRGKTDLHLDIKKQVKINATNKTNIKIDITAPMAEVYLNEYASADIKASLPQLSVSLNNHSTFDIKGNSQNASIEMSDRGQFKGDAFVIEKAILVAKDKSKTYINTSKNLDLVAKGKANVYIYNQPKIDLKAFEDHAVLYKK